MTRKFDNKVEMTLLITCLFLGVPCMILSARVLELSDRFLQLKKEGPWLVMFYAPWCGHCKRLEPIWSHVAQSLHDTEIRVGRVDCTRFTSVATEYSVTGFPTILFLKDDHRYAYKGDRTREDIVGFAKRMSGNHVRDVSSTSAFREVKKSEPTFFVYVGEKDGWLWECYEAIALELQPYILFYTSPRAYIEQHVKLKEVPAVFIYKENAAYFYTAPQEIENESVDDMGVDYLNSSLYDWVNKERFPTFIKVTRGNFHQVLKTGKYIVMAVLEEDKLGEITPEMRKFKNMVESVIRKQRDIFHENFLFGWVGTPELANSVAMETLPIPSLLVVNSTSYHHHLPEDEPSKLTEEAIVVFLEQILNNSVHIYGGDSFPVRMYRTYYEAKTSLVDMWRGNPVLTAVLFGLPLGFFSLICYSICCADIMDAEEEEEDATHEKKE